MPWIEAHKTDWQLTLGNIQRGAYPVYLSCHTGTPATVENELRGGGYARIRANGSDDNYNQWSAARVSPGYTVDVGDPPVTWEFLPRVRATWPRTRISFPAATSTWPAVRAFALSAASTGNPFLWTAAPFDIVLHAGEQIHISAGRFAVDVPINDGRIPADVVEAIQAGTHVYKAGYPEQFRTTPNIGRDTVLTERGVYALLQTVWSGKVWGLTLLRDSYVNLHRITDDSLPSDTNRISQSGYSWAIGIAGALVTAAARRGVVAANEIVAPAGDLTEGTWVNRTATSFTVNTVFSEERWTVQPTHWSLRHYLGRGRLGDLWAWGPISAADPVVRSVRKNVGFALHDFRLSFRRVPPAPEPGSETAPPTTIGGVQVSTLPPFRDEVLLGIVD